LSIEGPLSADDRQQEYWICEYQNTKRRSEGTFYHSNYDCVVFGAVHLRAGIIGQKALFIMKSIGVARRENDVPRKQ